MYGEADKTERSGGVTTAELDYKEDVRLSTKEDAGLEHLAILKPGGP